MFETSRHTIGLMLARWHFRRTRDEITSFTTAVSSARRALLVMPIFEEDLMPAMGVLEMLKARFKEKNITVVTGERGLEVVRALPNGQFIHLLRQQLSSLYIPNADFIRSITEKQFDLAIDLNLDLVLPSGYICKASGARVRVGFSQRHADAFYNFQIKTDPTLGKKLIYDRLVQCLQNF